ASTRRASRTSRTPATSGSSTTSCASTSSKRPFATLGPPLFGTGRLRYSGRPRRGATHGREKEEAGRAGTRGDAADDAAAAGDASRHDGRGPRRDARD